MIDKINALIVIPARYNSSRFPGKPLIKINGIPMIKRTYNQALKNKYTTDIIVATDSEKIKSFCEDNKIPVIITSDCETGTDRVAAVTELMPQFDFYVNLQGDEPVIDPKYINKCIEKYIQYYPKYSLVTGYGQLTKIQASLPETVKITFNSEEEALNFSRSPISNNSNQFFNHIGIYCFSKSVLDKFSNTPRTTNEVAEQVEMIRMLDMGIKIKLFKMEKTYAVDIPSDVINVEKFLDEKKVENL